MTHAQGIPAFLTPTGANTLVETGGIPIQFNEGGFGSGVRIPGNPKEHRIINGRKYLVEPGIVGDVAFVHAWKADTVGNLVFRYASNNYNGAMARNAKLTIVEAEEIVYVIRPQRSTPHKALRSEFHPAVPLALCRRTPSTFPEFTLIASSRPPSPRTSRSS